MINLGNKIIQDLKLGDKRVHRVYLGGPDNMLKGTKDDRTLPASTSNYNFAIYYFDTPLDVEAGDKFTVSVENIEVLEGNPPAIAVLLYDISAKMNYSNILRLTKDNLTGTMTVPRKGIVKQLLIYSGVNGATAGISIKIGKVMLVKGETPAPYWTPAPSEATEDSCMIWKEEQPLNLLLNSDFKNGTIHWNLSENVSIDTNKVFQGRYSVLNNQEENTSQKYRALQQYVDNPIPGENYTVSVWAYTDDLSSFDLNCVLEIWFLNKYGTRIVGPHKTRSFIPTKENEWQHFSALSGTCPEEATKIEVHINVVQNGKIWFNSPKLEVGSNDYPEWTPAASETENIILNSTNNGEGWNNSKYPTATRALTEPAIEGELYTITVWGSFGANQNRFEIYNSGDRLRVGRCTEISPGCYSLTFRWHNTDEYVTSPVTGKSIWVYALPGTYTEDTTKSEITKIKLEKGRNPNPVWSPNLKDIANSLVCYYNPKLQGCTNENMASNPILQDLSGNGVNLECKNFSWNTNSGVASDGSLRFDGVDDVCHASNKPILTDFTVIVNRKYIRNSKSILASTSNTIGGTDYGEFIMDLFDNGSFVQSFESGNIAIDAPAINTYETYSFSKNNYNGKSITAGTGAGNQWLTIGSIRPTDAYGRFFYGNISSFMLFNRTLSSAEIEWIKNNSTVELRNIKNLTAPESIPNFYPYSTDFSKWKNWLTYNTYWSCGNSEEIEEGDWIRVNGVISDKNNAPIQFIAKVIGRQISNGINQVQVSKETAYLIY